jgi:nucleoside-diphosphate-sugar epimerase
MNVLITGATGFIGSHLASKLSEKHNIKCLVRRNSETNFLRKFDCEIFAGDITDIKSLDKCFEDVDVVYHLACQMKGRGVTKNDYWNVNVQGTRNIIEKCLEKNVEQLIFTGTGSGLLVKNEKPINENYADFDNSNFYKVSKMEAEKIVLKNKNSLNVTVIAPDYIFGPGSVATLGYVKLAKRKIIAIFNNGSNLIQPAYIEDVVQGLLLALKNKKAFGEKFFITYKDAIRSRDFIDVIASKLGNNPKYLSFPKNFVKPILFLSRFVKAEISMESYIDFFTLNHLYDISKAERLLGYKPAFDIEQMVELSINWYKENGLL